MQPVSLLATLSGRNRPGVTAAVFAALAAYDVDVRDVEQVVIRDRLILAILLDLRGEPGALRASLSQAAHAIGIECELVLAPPRAPERRARSHVIVIGHPLRPGSVATITQR